MPHFHIKKVCICVYVYRDRTHHPVSEVAQVAQVQEEGQHESLGCSDPLLVPVHGLGDVCQVMKWWLDTSELHR